MTTNAIVFTNNEAELKNVSVRCSRQSRYYFGNKEIYIHHKTEDGYILGSTISVEAMQPNTTKHFIQNLPPPLNTYIYPYPLYAFKVNTNNNNGIVPINVESFLEMCKTLEANAHNVTKIMSIYDVPAVPLFEYVNDDNVEDNSSSDGEDYYEEAPETDNSDEDEWGGEDEEDDCIPNNTIESVPTAC